MRREQRLQASRRSQGETGSKREGVEEEEQAGAEEKEEHEEEGVQAKGEDQK